jgi:hypothetical protein
MSKVYAVGVIQADLSENPRRFIKDQRLWFLYSKFEDAEKCVLENHSDIFEYYYNFAVIEEVYVIDPSSPRKKDEGNYVPKQWWYKADFSAGREGDHHPVITSVEQPKCMENICCIWIG